MKKIYLVYTCTTKLRSHKKEKKPVYNLMQNLRYEKQNQYNLS